MNENGKIEPEELRFIYQLILEGRKDSDILNEYIRLKEVGELNFPLRTDDSFIKDRRKEIEITSEVLKDSIKKIMHPFILKQREEHVAQLAEISDTLFQNNLKTVTESKSEAIYGFPSKGIYKSRYTIKDINDIPIQMNNMQLINLFRKNVEKACKRYTYIFFYECYVSHLKAVIPEMEAEGFWPQVEKQPYEVLTAIKELAKQRELKGTCPLCSNLESRLPPFIRL